MTLQDYKIEEEYIRISKKELEEWQKRYQLLSVESQDSFHQAFYAGKRDICIELLKMF